MKAHNKLGGYLCFSSAEQKQSSLQEKFIEGESSCSAGRPRLLLLLFAGEGRSEGVSSLPLFLFWRDGTGRHDAGRVPDGRSVVMTGSGPKLGVLLLLAVLLQTVVVTITVLHFTTALNSVRHEVKGSDARWLLRIAEQRAPRSRAQLLEIQPAC